MKLFTKLKSILLVLVVACGSLVVFSACKPDKLEKVVGTYELVRDTYQRYEEEMIDRMEEYGLKSYLVVTGGDYGWYVVKDNDIAVTCREVKLEYLKNDKDEVTTVYYTLDDSPQQHGLTVNSKSEGISLISRWPSPNKLMPAYDIEYKRVSSATDTSYVEGIYADLPVFKYGHYCFDGICETVIEDRDDGALYPYIYRFYEIDAAKGKATLYYALKADETKHTETDLTVTFTHSEQSDFPVKLTIGDAEYDIVDRNAGRNITVGENEIHENVYVYGRYSEYKMTTAYFDSLIEAYRQTESK